MNEKQKIIIRIAIIIIVAMAIFPPWRVETGRIFISPDEFTPSMVVSGKYGFLFDPPHRAKEIDTSRLAVQAVIVVMLATGLIITVNKKEDC